MINVEKFEKRGQYFVSNSQEVLVSLVVLLAHLLQRFQELRLDPLQREEEESVAGKESREQEKKRAKNRRGRVKGGNEARVGVGKGRVIFLIFLYKLKHTLVPLGPDGP